MVQEGFGALPTFLQYNKIFEGKFLSLEKRAWFKQDEFPIEIKTQNHYHSILVCPVSKEVILDQNYPILLPCNHVISK